MRGHKTFETNHGIGENAGKKEWFLTLHANSYEMGEVRKAIDTAVTALVEKYRRSEGDRETQHECISAEVTLKNVAKAFNGELAEF